MYRQSFPGDYSSNCNYQNELRRKVVINLDKDFVQNCFETGKY